MMDTMDTWRCIHVMVMVCVGLRLRSQCSCCRLVVSSFHGDDDCVQQQQQQAPDRLSSTFPCLHLPHNSFSSSSSSNLSTTSPTAAPTPAAPHCKCFSPISHLRTQSELRLAHTDPLRRISSLRLLRRCPFHPCQPPQSAHRIRIYTIWTAVVFPLPLP